MNCFCCLHVMHMNKLNVKNTKQEKKKRKKLKRSQNNLRPTSACVQKFRKGHSLAIGQISQKKQTKNPNNDRPSNKKLFLRINLQGPNGYAVPIDSTRQLFFRFL